MSVSFRSLCFAVAGLPLMAMAASAQVTLSLDKSVYSSSDTIKVTWSGRTGATATDWIGIYPTGVTPGSQASTRWFYVNGTKVPTVPFAAGTVSFPNNGLAAGSWTAHFLAEDGYTSLASKQFTISGSSRSLASFTLNKSSYLVGETITASWSGLTSPAGTDWIGIYPQSLSGVPDGNPASTIWYYVNNTKIATTGAAAGSVSFTNPGLPVGNWRAYFLLDDAYAFLGTVDFTVVALPPEPILGFTADHTFLSDGATVVLSWVLNPGLTITSATISDGVVTNDVLGVRTLVVQPAATTTYTLRVNGTKTATARVFDDHQPDSEFSVSDKVADSASPVRFSWNHLSPNPDSWVGVYRIGDVPGPTPSIAWSYLNGTLVPGGSHPSGNLQFSLPAGDYFAVLFANSGYDAILKGPIRFRAAPGPFGPLAITDFGFDEGDYRIEWNSRPGRRYDLEALTDTLEWRKVKRDWEASSSKSTLFTVPDEPKGIFRIREK